MADIGRSTSNIVEKNKEKIPAGKKRLIQMVKGAAGIKKKPSPLFPENGLSIVERYFHRMPNTSPQVVLTYGGRIIMPEKATFLSVERLVDVNKRTAAKVFRCASVVDYDTQTFIPMGDTAADIKVSLKFTELVDNTTHRNVQQQEVNQRYDTKSKELPLWSIHIVGPKEMEQGISVNADIPGATPMQEFPKFYIFWSFHHCIADGLSGWAFIRLFMSEMSQEFFQRSRIQLDHFPIVKYPPPILDNYIDPHLMDLIPGIFDLQSDV
jgi:hypothetical protein